MAQQGSEQGRAGKKKKTNSLKPQYDPEDEAELLIEQDYYKQRPRILRLDKLTVEDVEDLNIKDFRLMNVALTVANLVQGNGGFDELVKVVPQTGIDAEGTAQYLEGDDYWEEFNCGRQHVTVGRCEREVLVSYLPRYLAYNEMLILIGQCALRIRRVQRRRHYLGRSFHTESSAVVHVDDTG